MGRNIVQLLSALASEDSASLGSLGFLHESELGKLLENVTVDLASAQREVVRSASESLSTTEDLSQSTNTDVGSDVNSTGDGGRSGVNPVSIIRSELLEGGGLDDVSPL